MSNVQAAEVQTLMEKIILNSWPEGYPKIPEEFPVMTYSEAMRDYGTDKPDLRIPSKVRCLACIV